MRKTEIKQELLPLGIGLLLFIAAYVVSSIYVNLPKWLSIILGLLPVAAASFETLCSAAEKLRRGSFLSPELLVILAVIGTCCMGNFTEGFTVLLAFGIAGFIERNLTARCRKNAPYLAFLRPEYVAVELDGKMNLVAPERIRPGTIMTVGTDELIPLDGIVVDGSSVLDASAYTGDSSPIDVGVGNEVVSGCVNRGGVLKIRVTALYNNSTLVRTSAIVDEAPRKAGRREARITRVVKLITPCVFILAILLAVVPSIITDEWLDWTHRALIFLAVGSGAAVLGAVATAYFAGLSAAVTRGIVLRGKNELEAMAKCASVVMDKTGTVTEGSFTVTGVEPKGISSADLVSIAAAAESFSNHPIAQSLRRAATTVIPAEYVTNVRELSGRGIEADVYGRRVLVGNSTLMNSNGIKCDLTDRHLSVVHVSVGGIYYGYIIIDDKVKDGAKDAVRELYSLGVEKTVLLTGDTERVGKAVGRALGVSEVMAGLLPEDKVVAVGELLREKHTGKLAFVGDAMTDAPVLARADVGVAMGALNADAPASRAGVLIMGDDIRELPLALRLCKKTSRAVLFAAALPLLTKFVILLLAALGSIGMSAAVIIDALAALIVTINAYRIR